MPVILYTTDQILSRGLLLAGMVLERQRKQNRDANIEDFKAVYGMHPLVLETIWEELQTATILSARIDTSKKRAIHLKNFLRAKQFFIFL